LDEDFQTFLNRAAHTILPDAYRSQVQFIQDSPKFCPLPEGGFEALPFPGYTVVTPPGSEDGSNLDLFTRLTAYQQQLVEQVGGHLFAPVPPSSFHLTLADLIWDNAYQSVVEENPQFESSLQQCMTGIFQEFQLPGESKPVPLQVLGLLLMTRAIGVCLVPTDEFAYSRILKFRRAIYQSHELMGLGVEQQYYFTPHITLGYFGKTPTAEEQISIGDRLVELNLQWLEAGAQTFWIQRAELRKFDTMTHYYRQPDWASVEF